MNRSLVFLVGVAVGGGAGAAAAVGLRSAPTRDDSAAPTRSPAAVPAPAGLDVARPAVTSAAAPAGEGSPAEQFESWYVEQAGRYPDPSRVVRPFWLALVEVYASSHRAGDLQRACDRALDSGVPPASLLAVLDKQGTSPDLPGLLARHPDAGWDLRSRLRVMDKGSVDPTPLLDGLRAERERVVASFAGKAVPGPESGQPNLDELLARLAAVDPARAIAEAHALIDAGAWPPWIAGSAARALRADPSSALRFVRLGLVASPVDDGLLAVFCDLDLPGATAHLQSVLAGDPKVVEAWEWLAEARERAEDGRGAFAAAVCAAELDPTCERLQRLYDLDASAARPLIARLAEGGRDPGSWTLLAAAELRAGAPNAALDAWLRALDLSPFDVAPYDADIWIALSPRRVADAMAPHVEHAFVTSTDDYVRSYLRALVDARDPRAFEVASRAIEKGMTWNEFYSLLAQADAARALPVLEGRKPTGPEDAFELARGLGEAYLGVGKRTEAIAAYERALGMAEERGWWFPDLWVGVARADPVGGMDRLRKAAEVHGDTANDWGMIGDALSALGRTSEARDAYRRALDAEPDASLWRGRLAALR